MNNFSWLPISLTKNISEPFVEFKEHDKLGSGYYISELKKIVVADVNRVEDILAHEYRHHIQCTLNIHKSNISSIINNDLSYEDSIAEYFATQEHELDALLFEYKYAKTELNEWWLKDLTKRRLHSSLHYLIPKQLYI